MSAPTEFKPQRRSPFPREHRCGHTAIKTAAGEFQHLVHPNADMHYGVWSDDLNIEDTSTARTIVASDLIPQRSIAESRRTEKLSPMQRLLLEDTNMVVFRVRSSK